MTGVSLTRRRFFTVLAASGIFWLDGKGAVFGRSQRKGTGSPLVLGRPMMGTVVEIQALHPDPAVAHAGIVAALDRMAIVDSLMSVQQPQSEINRISRLAAKGPIPIEADTYRVLTEAMALAKFTKGTIDVTVRPLVAVWERAMAQGRPPSPQELDAALPLVSYDDMHIGLTPPTVSLSRSGMALDLGGIAKGYAVDVGVETLTHLGILQGVIDAGGDIRVLGRGPGGQPWRIALRHPLEPRRFLLTILADNEGIATSGNYFTPFLIQGKAYGHLLDPRTGYATATLLSATVLTRSAIRADGLATAVMLLGLDPALALLERSPMTEGILVTRSPTRPGRLSVHITRGLRGRIELLARDTDIVA